MDATAALTLWVAEGQLDAATAHRLRVSLEGYEAPERQNKIIGVIVSIGALLIGGGLLLFIASQWDESSPLRRLLVQFAIWAVTVAAAAFAGRQQLDITSRGLWFLSSIAVGVNIFLVGQIFNLPLNYWQGTLLWLIATLAAGWAAPSSAQGWLAVPLGILTLGWITTPQSRFGEQWSFLWEPASLKPVLPLVGVALVALAFLVRETDFSWLYRPAVAFGALMVAVPLTLSTFHPDAFASIFEIDFGALHALVILGTVALVARAWFQHPRSPLPLGAVAVMVLLLALLPQVSDSDRYSSRDDTVSWLAPAFDASGAAFWLYGFVIFGLALGAVIAGHHFGIKALVNAGVTTLGVQLFGLYVGRIAGALPTALAVIGGGLLLVGGAVLMERKRRELIDTAVTPVDEPPDAGPPVAGPPVAGPPVAGPPAAAAPVGVTPVAGPSLAGPPVAGPPVVVMPVDEGELQ